MVLVDTHRASDLQKARTGKADRHVVEWAEAIVTRNTVDFAETGVRLLNPWLSAREA